MRNHWIIALGLLMATAASARSADTELPQTIRDAKLLADKIDQLIEARCADKGVKPAALTGDGEFLRRVHLDLTGRIPRPADLLDFRDRYASHPRENWINKELLDSPEYVNHFAVTWRHLIAPQDSNQFGPGFGGAIEQWLRQKFRENAHFDQITRELIASPYAQNSITAAFVQTNQLKPENLAATTSRLFLGVKLECAQCHNHPFARWTKQQFWEFAAFYAGIGPRRGNVEGQMPAALVEDPTLREITIPETEKKVKARFLDGSEPQWKVGASTRETLADWLLRAENPFFARAAVNRLWAHFFGLGLVEPVDDLSDQNPASHPELLDLLAREFAAHDFDIKFMIRAITFSKTYQRSSVLSDPSQAADVRLFARMNLKGLTGEQLYDSVMIATDTPIAATAMPNQFAPATPRADFANRFAAQTNRTEYETSILQALTMMNGKILTDATSLEKSNTLKKIAADPLDTPQRVEALYMAVLTRKPRPDELDRFVKYIDSGGPRKDPKSALSDVFWALLNSAEFLLNH